MAKTILIYGSTTGNTEALSLHVAAGLKQGGADVTVKDVADTGVDELASYDAIVFGCSTWGDGELQDDFIDFHADLDGASLDGKKAAVFGPGDSDDYPDTFCEAVDILEKTLRDSSAEIVAESFKIDGDVEPAFGDAEAWGLNVAKAL
ncbi:MAG: flavodoxin [Methanosarcinales archaeon]|jgi:flavodoxin short chain|nr:flavodoxin [Methanosarcinales archaeon]